jgi:hypothetical protein
VDDVDDDAVDDVYDDAVDDESSSEDMPSEGTSRKNPMKLIHEIIMYYFF